MVTATHIKRIRLLLRESQAEFAKRFGVGQPTVHRWETLGPPDQGTAHLLLEREIASIEQQLRDAAE